MKSLLPLCSIPIKSLKDGMAGQFGRLLLPFYSLGYWFGSGAEVTFPDGQIRQDNTGTLGGTDKPDTYRKQAEICIKGA